MCIGIPLRVETIDAAGAALCRNGEEALRRVEVSLLDAPPQPGDWLLVHMDVAIRALDASEARQIGDALRAVAAAASGEPFEHLLADLINRTPELPPHLRAGADAALPKDLETGS